VAKFIIETDTAGHAIFNTLRIIQASRVSLRLHPETIRLPTPTAIFVSGDTIITIGKLGARRLLAFEAGNRYCRRRTAPAFVSRHWQDKEGLAKGPNRSLGTCTLSRWHKGERTGLIYIDIRTRFIEAKEVLQSLGLFRTRWLRRTT